LDAPSIAWYQKQGHSIIAVAFAVLGFMFNKEENMIVISKEIAALLTSVRTWKNS